jgi:hypothetical protein
MDPCDPWSFTSPKDIYVFIKVTNTNIIVDDLNTQNIIKKGLQYFKRTCNTEYRSRDIHVYIFMGNIDEKSWKSQWLAKATFVNEWNRELNGYNWEESSLTQYGNKVSEAIERARREEVARQRAAEEAARRAELKRRKAELERKKAEENRIREEQKKREIEKKKEDAKKRLNEFVSKNGVKAYPSIDELYANPFVYEGKTIAIVAFFEAMESATSGIFMVSTGQWSNPKPFFVSGIPKGIFRVSGKVIFLAGKVLGKTETPLPLFGLQVPHLKFVDVHFCKDNKCSDIIPDYD